MSPRSELEPVAVAEYIPEPEPVAAAPNPCPSRSRFTRPPLRRQRWWRPRHMSPSPSPSRSQPSPGTSPSRSPPRPNPCPSRSPSHFRLLPPRRPGPRSLHTSPRSSSSQSQPPNTFPSKSPRSRPNTSPSPSRSPLSSSPSRSRRARDAAVEPEPIAAVVEPEPEPIAAAAEAASESARTDVVPQPTWQIVAPDTPPRPRTATRPKSFRPRRPPADAAPAAVAGRTGVAAAQRGAPVPAAAADDDAGHGGALGGVGARRRRTEQGRTRRWRPVVHELRSVTLRDCPVLSSLRDSPGLTPRDQGREAASSSSVSIRTRTQAAPTSRIIETRFSQANATKTVPRVP